MQHRIPGRTIRDIHIRRNGIFSPDDANRSEEASSAWFIIPKKKLNLLEARPIYLDIVFRYEEELERDRERKMELQYIIGVN